VRDVWPKTRAQRDWFHKLGNILDKLPKRLQPRVKAALHEGMYAETRAHARDAITRFATEYGPKYPKAVTTLEQDADVLLTFFDFPAKHWKHLRTSNVIESPFATVRLRQRVTKGAGSRTKGLLMAYKLLAMAQALWRRLDGAHLLPLVREGVVFVDGVQQASKRGKPRARAASSPPRAPIHLSTSTQNSRTLSEVALDQAKLAGSFFGTQNFMRLHAA
jgi:putative transposase